MTADNEPKISDCSLNRSLQDGVPGGFRTTPGLILDPSRRTMENTELGNLLSFDVYSFGATLLVVLAGARCVHATSC